MSDIDNSRLFYIDTCVPIKSFSSKDIYYITIVYNKSRKRLEFNCTCGLKFDIGQRTKCKHITKIKKSLHELPVADNFNDVLSNLSNMAI